jgi:hypothetical protein
MRNATSERALLEQRTTRELARMADREGIDIPPDLDRAFIIRELLENSAAPPPPADDPEPDGRNRPVPLPRKYNITWLEILPRDPLWVFVFWEIRSQDRERFEAAANFEGYCLRSCAAGQDTAFTVPVGSGDTAWYLGLPPARGGYTVELCVCFRHDKGPLVRPLAACGPFLMPLFFGEAGEGADNPLIRLSGAVWFPRRRSFERPSRPSL